MVTVNKRELCALQNRVHWLPYVASKVHLGMDLINQMFLNLKYAFKQYTNYARCTFVMTH